MNLGAEYNLIKTRSSINDQKSSHLNRTRDKTPKIESTTLSMRVPNSKPKTTAQDNSIGRYNGESAFGVQKINDSAEIDIHNNNVTPMMNQTESTKIADTRPYADAAVGYESNLDNQINNDVGFLRRVPNEKYKSMNLKTGKYQQALTSLEHPIIARKRDLVKNFQRIKMQNRLL